MGVRDTIAKAIMGIKAYHSSPHDFDKFDLKKIGTGEGAQVYGHGLYFAENPAVSGQGGQYWQQFQPRFKGAEGDAAAFLKKNEFDREKTIEMARQYIKDAEGYYETVKTPLADRAVEHYKNVLHYLESDNPVGPRTYEVNIKADPAQMLDWDKGLAEQSGSTRDALRSVLKQMPETHSGNMLWQLDNPRSQTSGANVYDFLASGNNQRAASAASLALREAGIPGIKYLDEGSRQPAQLYEQLKKDLPLYRERGNQSAVASIEQQLANPPALTSNYVVFDPANIDILKKYGVAAAPTAALGATYDQSQYEVQP